MSCYEEKFYKELNKVVDVDLMEEKGYYVTYYNSGFDFMNRWAEQSGEEKKDWNKDDVLEVLCEYGLPYDFNVDEAFVMVDDQHSEGGYIFEAETSEVIEHMENEKSTFKKFMRQEGN